MIDIFADLPVFSSLRRLDLELDLDNEIISFVEVHYTTLTSLRLHLSSEEDEVRHLYTGGKSVCSRYSLPLQHAPSSTALPTLHPSSFPIHMSRIFVCIMGTIVKRIYTRNEPRLFWNNTYPSRGVLSSSLSLSSSLLSPT